MKHYLTIAELHFDAHLCNVTSIGHYPAPTFTPALHLAEYAYYSAQIFAQQNEEFEPAFRIRFDSLFPSFPPRFARSFVYLLLRGYMFGSFLSKNRILTLLIRSLWLKASSCIQAEEVSLLYFLILPTSSHLRCYFQLFPLFLINLIYQWQWNAWRDARSYWLIVEPRSYGSHIGMWDFLLSSSFFFFFLFCVIYLFYVLTFSTSTHNRNITIHGIERKLQEISGQNTVTSAADYFMRENYEQVVAYLEPVARSSTESPLEEPDGRHKVSLLLLSLLPPSRSPLLLLPLFSFPPLPSSLLLKLSPSCLSLSYFFLGRHKLKTKQAQNI